MSIGSKTLCGFCLCQMLGCVENSISHQHRQLISPLNHDTLGVIASYGARRSEPHDRGEGGRGGRSQEGEIASQFEVGDIPDVGGGQCRPQAERRRSEDTEVGAKELE